MRPAVPASVTGAPIPSLNLPLALLVLAAALAWQVGWTRALRLSHLEREERVYPLLADWVDTHLPPNAVLAVNQVSGALMYYSERTFLIHYRFTPEENARLTAWLGREKRPLYAILYAYEEEGVRERMPGRWEAVASLRQATLWRRVSP